MDRKKGKKEQKIKIKCHVSRITCHVSCVMLLVSHVTCHLSLTPTATATDPPPANSPIMHSRLVGKEPKIPKKFKTQIITKTTKTKKGLEVCQY